MRQGLSLSWRCSSRLPTWLQSLGSIHHSLPAPGLQVWNYPCTTFVKMWVLGVKVVSSCLQSKLFDQLSCFPGPKFLISKVYFSQFPHFVRYCPDKTVLFCLGILTKHFERRENELSPSETHHKQQEEEVTRLDCHPVLQAPGRHVTKKGSS